MNTYTIEAARVTRLRATVEAATREEAFQLVDTEFIDDDFEEIGSEFTFTYCS
jgi:hypothetical protein